MRLVMRLTISTSYSRIREDDCAYISRLPF